MGVKRKRLNRLKTTKLKKKQIKTTIKLQKPGDSSKYTLHGSDINNINTSK